VGGVVAGPKTWEPPTLAQLEVCESNLYRISKDIAPQFYSTMYNLQHTSLYQDLHKPMSRPGQLLQLPQIIH